MPKAAQPSAVDSAPILGEHPRTEPNGGNPNGAVADRAREVSVAGRRYRLVPLDEDDPHASDAMPAAELLTARELQIVVLVAEGRVNKQIADVLRISEWTVSTHLRRIFAKLHVDTRAAMVSRCYGPIPAIHRD